MHIHAGNYFILANVEDDRRWRW